MRPRRDVDDLDNLFDREEAERRRQDRAAMIESGKAMQAAIDAQEAAARLRAKEGMLRATDIAILREYQHAGVEPIKVRGDGVPTCSLSLLLRLGWRIDEFNGAKTLIAPPAPPTYVPIQRENS